MRHPSRGCPRGLHASPPRAREARVSPGPHEAGLVGPPDRGSAPPGGSNRAHGRGPIKPAWWGAPGRYLARLLAAWSSRWWRTPPPSPLQCSAHPRSWTKPQPWQVLELAKHRSASTTSEPYQGVWYRSCRRSSARAASAGPRRRARAPGIPFWRSLPAASSPSPTIRPWGVASRVVSRGIPWRRRAARWAWSRARRRSLRRQRFEPHWLRERDRERRRSTVRFRASGAGLGTRSITPSAVAMVASQRTPTSTPTLEAGSGWPWCRAPHEAGLGTPSERAPMGNPRGPPLRAIVLERGHRPGRPMGGGTPAVGPGTEAAQELAPVSDQVLVDLGGIDPHQPPSLSGEGSLHLLGPEPHEAAPRLDHDRGHGRVT